MSAVHFIESGAIFDPARVYRYQLRRVWDAKLPVICFIGLNPSTADEEKLDPTMRREIGFARALGFGGLLKANIFGFRSTSPNALYDVSDPVGPDNDSWIVHCVRQAAFVVAAWGNHGTLHDRGVAVERLVTAWKPLHCLSLTKPGMPGHPLYLPKTARPQLYRAFGVAA